MCAFVHALWMNIAISLVGSAPTFQGLSAPSNDELAFMKRYGYLREQKQPDEELAYTPHSISDAVVKLQAFAGIPQTGVLDEETKKLFIRKRCGVKDIYNATGRRRRRFVVTQGWTNKTVTYKVLNGSRKLAKSRVEELMAAALAVWAPYGGLRFVKKDQGPANIEVSFSTGDHGDVMPFDGPGRALAHAFAPPTGAMHFDDDEYWVDNFAEEDFYDVTDFYSVAVHESGHALGLYHSDVPTAVMYPYYQGTDHLDQDDILAMHELYLKEDQSTESTTDGNLASPFTRTSSREADEHEVPDICFANYDTIQVIQGKIFVFEDEWLWVLKRRKVIEDGYPKKYHEVFVGLPSDVTLIRAIYEKQNANVVIFSGRNYWEFDPTFHLIKSGKISDYLLPKKVTELSTAFLSNYNNKTYLIDEVRFWRFDERAGRMDRKYPKSMSAWREVPYPVDAAIIWEGDTFFFQGSRFWRFDNRLVQAHEYYPQPLAPVWFPCEFRTDIPYSHTKRTRRV